MKKTCNLEEATVAEKEKRGKENEDMILRILLISQCYLPTSLILNCTVFRHGSVRRSFAFVENFAVRCIKSESAINKKFYSH